MYACMYMYVYYMYMSMSVNSLRALSTKIEIIIQKYPEKYVLLQAIYLNIIKNISILLLSIYKNVNYAKYTYKTIIYITCYEKS